MTKAGISGTKGHSGMKDVYVPLEQVSTSQVHGASRRAIPLVGCLLSCSVALVLICALMFGMTTGYFVRKSVPCSLAAATHDSFASGVEISKANRTQLDMDLPDHEMYKRHANPRGHHHRRGQSKQHKTTLKDSEFDHGKPIVHDADPKLQNESYSFEDIFDPALRPRGFDGTWMSDDLFVYRDVQDGNVYSWDAATSQRQMLMPNDTLVDLNTGTYFVSPDLNYVLIAYETSRVWRHSYTARYVIYNVTEEDEDRQLIEFPNSDELAGEILQLARWANTGNTLSFVYGNNMYYQDSVTAEAEQVTETGQQPYIFNAIPDWMYEEDVVGSAVGHFFSDDDQYVVYVKYNDTGVSLQAWPFYGPKEDVYGQTMEIAYPKAGDIRDGELGPITHVTLYVVNTDDVSTHTVLSPPSQFSDEDHYYTRIAWIENRIFVTWTNRAQNHTVYMMYDPDTGESNQNYEFEVPNGWINSPSTHPWPIPGENAYWTILSEPIADDSWPHVALVTAPVNAEGDVTFVQSGEMAVDSIVGYDADNHYVYFISTNFDPTERHIYRAGTQDAAEPDPVCLTCGYAETCRYVSASFSKTGTYYFESCLGPDVPSYRLRSVDNVTNEVLEDNSDVRARLSVKQLPTRNFVEFPVTDGYMARADVYYPYNFDITKTYKVLLYPYAGPNSQRVYKTFPIGSNTNNWLMYMKSTEHNTVVASVDARGTVLRSDNFRFLIYRKLGLVEIEDQLEATRYFRGQDYFDSEDKMAMFGWSYGGFVTSKTLAMSGDEELQCGLAVAPVTTKRYYDSAYTERYLAFDLPGDNQAGYDNTDIMSVASQFHGKDYLIAHGTHDDNVHFMHMAQLVTALMQEEYQFRQLMYPDEHHSINSDKQARHLYRALTNFLVQDCWQQ